MIQLDNIVNKNTIMIVDDEPKNIQLLGTLLTQYNYNIIPATNGINALEKLQKVKPDIILLDVMMPELDGFETCRRIKRDEETADIPIIFLTAKTDKGDIIEGLSVGAVDYVTKPFNHKELLMRVATQVDLVNAKKQLKQQVNATNELLHVLCHDLTNPIGSISSLLDIVKTKEDFAEIMPMITNAADDCLEIITLVKAMSAVDTGKTILRITKVNLYDIIQSSLITLNSYIKEKDITVNCNVTEDSFVLAEKTALKNSILNNLLTNAIKFSNRGGSIDISAEKGEGKLVLRIKDNGIGIPETLLDKIFQPGKATSRQGTEGETGTGFGMPVAKKFMENFEGTIDVSSREGEGTEVTLTFQTW